MSRKITTANGVVIHVTETPVTKKLLAEICYADGDVWKSKTFHASASDGEIAAGLDLVVPDHTPPRPGAITWIKLVGMDLRDTTISWEMRRGESCVGHIDRTYLEGRKLIIHMDVVEDTYQRHEDDEFSVHYDKTITVDEYCRATLKENGILELPGRCVCNDVICFIHLKKS